MSSVTGFVKYPILSVVPLQVPHEVEEALFQSDIFRRPRGELVHWTQNEELDACEGRRCVGQSVDTDDAINSWFARGALPLNICKLTPALACHVVLGLLLVLHVVPLGLLGEC